MERAKGLCATPELNEKQFVSAFLGTKRKGCFRLMCTVIPRPDTDNSAVPCCLVSAMRHLLPWFPHGELRANQYGATDVIGFYPIVHLWSCKGCVAKREHMSVRVNNVSTCETSPFVGCTLGLHCVLTQRAPC